MSKLVKYDVGTNFDYKIFDVIKECDKEHRIKNLYGKLKRDDLPGGRPASIISELSDDQFAQYIKDCSSLGLTFNYLINPVCMGQAEYDPVEGKNIRDTIHKLYDMGVRYFTINSPSLIKYVKSEFKDVQITLGLYAYPASIQQIEYWRNWGVDEITLYLSFNRNFDLLRKLMNIYKDSDFAMRIIGNNFCLRECPYGPAHAGFVGHSDPSAISMDFNLVNCTYRKVSNPKAMLTSEWVRPEDIHYYEELAEETGYKNFSIKLVDRTRATSFIERVVRAYSNESFDGNLLDIVNWPDTKNIAREGISIASQGGPKAGMPAGGPPPGAPIVRFMDQMNSTFAPIYGRVMNFPKMYIDNKKLDGFLEHFIKHYNCANSLCAGTIIEDGMKCGHACDYCGSWVDKAISYDKEEVEAWKKVAETFLNGIPAGAQYEK